MRQLIHCDCRTNCKNIEVYYPEIVLVLHRTFNVAYSVSLNNSFNIDEKVKSIFLGIQFLVIENRENKSDKICLLT